MQALPFRKMHGLGNDFVVLDARPRPLDLSPEAIRRIGDRHRGVGFDQLVVIEPARNGGDARVSFYNPDGGEAGACGNGTRCAARLLLDELGRDRIVLESAPGPLPVERVADGRVRVAMSAPRFGGRDTPLAVPCDTLNVPLDRPPLRGCS